MSLYETFSSKETDDIQDGAVNPINGSRSESSSAMQTKKRFSASSYWCQRFLKRYGLRSVLLPTNAASNNRIATKTHMKINSHSNREYEREPVSNMDESGIFTKRFLSRKLNIEGETSNSGLKACKEHKLNLMISNATGCLLKPAFICEPKIRGVLKQNNKNSQPAQIGWISEQLAHVLNLAKQLKENSQKWDEDMDRWVQFCSRIDGVMKQYQLLYKQTKMQRRQLPITLFFYPLNRRD